MCYQKEGRIVAAADKKSWKVWYSSVMKLSLVFHAMVQSQDKCDLVVEKKSSETTAKIVK